MVLTAREQTIMRHVANGLPSAVIAKKLTLRTMLKTVQLFTKPIDMLHNMLYIVNNT